jgi:hypothetical protein
MKTIAIAACFMNPEQSSAFWDGPRNSPGAKPYTEAPLVYPSSFSQVITYDIWIAVTRRIRVRIRIGVTVWIEE